MSDFEILLLELRYRRHRIQEVKKFFVYWHLYSKLNLNFALKQKKTSKENQIRKEKSTANSSELREE